MNKAYLYQTDGREIIRFGIITTLLCYVQYFLEIAQPHSSMINIVFAGHYVRFRFGLEQIRLIY